MMPQGPILMTRPVNPKPKNQFGGAAWGPWAQAPPKLVFGLWLERPGHQDGALGHHAGVLHDSPGIMQALHDFHESCGTFYSMLFGILELPSIKASIIAGTATILAKMSQSFEI